MLAQAAPTVSLSPDEQRIAVHRRLYHRSQIQPLLRLRTHAAGDRALVADGQRRAARSDGAVAGAHGRGRAGPTRSRAESGLVFWFGSSLPFCRKISKRTSEPKATLESFAFLASFSNPKSAPAVAADMTNVGLGTLERFRTKACPGLDPGWIPVRVKKARQDKKPEPGLDSIRAGSALINATRCARGGL